jgi:hypothetical protein
MATYFKRKNKDRTTSIVTNVRIKGFKPTSQSFKTIADAKAWAEPLEKQLKDQAKRGGARKDIATLTLGALITEFLEDRTPKRSSPSRTSTTALTGGAPTRSCPRRRWWTSASCTCATRAPS